MCGIGGYSLSSNTGLNATGITQVLLAGLAERGQDATGWAWRPADGPIEVRKASRPLASVIDDVAVAPDARQGIVHVREYHQGRPRHRGQQPPRALGPRRRRAQRAPRQRRRAVRRVRPAALDGRSSRSTPRRS
jgi:glutamine phosphoribosylpyrophosphate amidotransferase